MKFGQPVVELEKISITDEVVALGSSDGGGAGLDFCTGNVKVDTTCTDGTCLKDSSGCSDGVTV